MYNVSFFLAFPRFCESKYSSEIIWDGNLFLLLELGSLAICFMNGWWKVPGKTKKEMMLIPQTCMPFVSLLGIDKSYTCQKRNKEVTTKPHHEKEKVRHMVKEKMLLFFLTVFQPPSFKSSETWSGIFELMKELLNRTSLPVSLDPKFGLFTGPLPLTNWQADFFLNYHPSCDRFSHIQQEFLWFNPWAGNQIHCNTLNSSSLSLSLSLSPRSIYICFSLFLSHVLISPFSLSLSLSLSRRCSEWNGYCRSSISLTILLSVKGK